MVRNFLLLICLLASSLMCQAQSGNGTIIDLDVGYTDPTPSHNSNPKSPALISAPVICLNDHLLTFITDCEGIELQIVSVVEGEEITVYSTSIAANTTSLQLPTNLNGDYLIRFIWGNWMFYGWINL